MKKIDKKTSFILLMVTLIAGYSSLALELVAIRQVIPYLDSDTIITSIIIGVVLIFLSLGYYKAEKIDITKISIRQKLVKNFVISMIFLFIGTTYIFFDYYFLIFSYLNLNSRILQAFLFSFIFLSIPSYLIAQTTPLIAMYFAKNTNTKMMGKLLAFGTIGSFAGSIFTTLVIMPIFGVNYAVIFNIFITTIAIVMLNKKNRLDVYIICFIFLIITFLFNNTKLQSQLGILSNNGYSTIKILNTDNDLSKVMIINNSFASKISKSENLMFEYVKYINRNFIFTLPRNEKKNILILGAGGFTMGIRDDYNNYTYVDIDESLLDISEKYFLEEKLTNNKKFVKLPARAFLKNDNGKYDLIILDTYSNQISIPASLITVEYFSEVKDKLKDNGIIVLNAISSANFSDSFSMRLDNTLNYVFKNISKQVIGDYNPWNQNENNYRNILYIYYNKTPVDNVVYTDNNNSSIFDKKN